MDDNLQGLLVVLTDVVSTYDEDLARWYDEEHIPERVRVAGVLGADRYVRMSSQLPPGVQAATQLSEPPKHLIAYQLADLRAITSPDWIALNRDVSDRSRRSTAMMRNTHRAAYRHVRGFGTD